MNGRSEACPVRSGKGSKEPAAAGRGMASSSVAGVSPPPHLHREGATVSRAMLRVIIALLPALAVSLLVFGMSVVYVVTVSVLATRSWIAAW